MDLEMAQVETYLAQRLGRAVEVLGLQPLGGSRRQRPQMIRSR